MRKMMSVLIIVCMLASTAVLFAAGQEEGSKGPVELTYTTWMTKGEDKPWIDAFNAANDDVIVKMDMLEGGKYPELIRTRVLANDMPDVMMLMGNQIQEFSREGYLADITDTSAAKLQSSTPMAADYNSRDGKVYGLNITGGFMGHVWYNKKLFSDLGLSVPETMDEFWAVCEALKAADKDPMLLGGADTWTYKMLRFASWTTFADPAMKATGFGDIGEALYNGADVAEVYRGHAEFIDEMVKKGYLIQASLTTTWPQSSQIFVDGNVGMFPQGPWMATLPEVVAADPDKFEMGVFAMPIENEEGKRYVIATMDRFMGVSSKSDNLDASMDFFNFVTSDESLIGYLEPQGLTTLLDLDYELPQTIIDFKKMVTGEKYTAVPYVFPTPAAWENQESQMPKNIQSGATVEQALTEIKNYYLDGKETIKF